MSEPITQEYLSPADAALFLGLARPTVDRLMRRWRDSRGADGLRHARVSARCVRLARRDLAEYMSRRSRPSHFFQDGGPDAA